MTTTIISSDAIVAGAPAYTMDGRDLLILEAGVTVAVEGGTFLSATGFQNTIQIDGNVTVGKNDAGTNGGQAIQIASYGSALVIGETGRVIARTTSLNSTIVITGSTTVHNDGLIAQYGYGFGLLIDADFCLVDNGGTIFGQEGGVRMAGMGTLAHTLTNSGTISGGFSDFSDEYAGHGILAAGRLAIPDYDLNIVNSGVIEANYNGACSIRLGLDATLAVRNATIENDGVIRSYVWRGIDATFMTGILTLSNSGTISSDRQALIGSAGSDRITNTGVIETRGEGVGIDLGTGFDFLTSTGTILGAITLGVGPGRFYGGSMTAGVTFLSQGEDEIRMGSGDDDYTNLAGNDTVFGGAGNDTLSGGGDGELIYGGQGNDRLFAYSASRHHGGEGDDRLALSEGNETGFGGSGDDELVGGAGTQNAFGGEGDDDLSGGVGADFLNGGAGDDVLKGDSDNDVLHGGLGADTMEGGLGDDTFVIDSLADVVVELAGGGTLDEVQSALLSLNLGAYSEVENARLTGGGDLNLTGSGGGNLLTGNAGANRLTGLGGADTLTGGEGDDTLVGGSGQDSLTGGGGVDRFVFASVGDAGLGAAGDRIAGFVHLSDRIDLSDFSGVQVFRGALALTGVNQVSYNQATGVVSGSTDADAAAEWSVTLTNRPVISAADFVL